MKYIIFIYFKFILFYINELQEDKYKELGLNFTPCTIHVKIA